MICCDKCQEWYHFECVGVDIVRNKMIFRVQFQTLTTSTTCAPSARKRPQSKSKSPNKVLKSDKQKTSLILCTARLNKATKSPGKGLTKCSQFIKNENSRKLGLELMDGKEAMKSLRAEVTRCLISWFDAALRLLLARKPMSWWISKFSHLFLKAKWARKISFTPLIST